MKKLVLTVVLIMVSTAGYGEEKVSMSYFLCQPHILYDVDTRKVSGAIFELVEEHMAPKMGVTFVWDAAPTIVPRQLKNLSDEKKDAVAHLIYTPERAQKYAYPEKPYVIIKSAIGVLKENSLNQVERVEDLMNLKIGYAKKFYISPFMRDERVNFELVASNNPNIINLKKLLAKRIDAFYIPDKTGMLFAMRNLDAEQKVKIIELPDKAGNAHVVFSKSNKKLAERWTKVFAEINGEQVYSQIINKYIDVSRL